MRETEEKLAARRDELDETIAATRRERDRVLDDRRELEAIVSDASKVIADASRADTREKAIAERERAAAETESTLAAAGHELAARERRCDELERRCASDRAALNRRAADLDAEFDACAAATHALKLEKEKAAAEIKRRAAAVEEREMRLDGGVRAFELVDDGAWTRAPRRA